MDSYSYLPSGSLLASTGSTANPFTYLARPASWATGTGSTTCSRGATTRRRASSPPNDPLGQAGSGTNLREYAANDPVLESNPAGLLNLDLNGSAGLPGLGFTAGVQAGTDANGNFGIYPYYAGMPEPRASWRARRRADRRSAT